MKKIIAIVLTLILALSFTACTTNDSATKIKEDYQSYDWQNSMQTQKISKANELISRINMLPSSEQQEMTEIKRELEKMTKEMESPMPSNLPDIMNSPNPSMTPSPQSPNMM